MISNSGLYQARTWASMLVLPALFGCSASLSEFARKVNERQAAARAEPVEAKKASVSDKAPSGAGASIQTVKFAGMTESSVMMYRPKDLLRQYLLREGKNLPPTDILIPNVAAYLQNGDDSLHTLGNRYLSERHAFKKEDLKNAFEAEARNFLLTGSPSRFASFWLDAKIDRYDLHRNEVKVCIFGGCEDRTYPKDIRINFASRDYALLLRSVGPAIFKPDQYLARAIEDEANRTGDRSITAVFTFEISPRAIGPGVIEGKPYSLRLYKREQPYLSQPMIPVEGRFMLEINLKGQAQVGRIEPKPTPVATTPVPPPQSHRRVDDGFKKVFKRSPASVNSEAQIDIYRALQLKLGKMPGTFNNDSCDGIEVEANYQDLNKDGRPEVVVWERDGRHSRNCYGSGSNVSIFSPGPAGKYISVLGHKNPDNDGLDATVMKILPSGQGGFPDLSFGGRGWCTAVWRWQGEGYSYLRGIPTQKGGCD